MSATALRSEERLGLGIAVVAHLALIAALVVSAAHKPRAVQLPPRMVVSLADDVSLQATAPEPAPEAQAAIAETVAEKPKPKPVEKPPEPKKPAPVEKPTSKPRPVPKETPKPQPKPQPKPKTEKSSGSLIGKNFLAGLGASTASDKPAAAAEIGPDVSAALTQAIARQLRPHWSRPSGVDADKLVTILAFDLNPDGSLVSKPRVVAQSGVTDANRAQAGRHAELAIRAVELAAPFDLPAKYYSAWKHIRRSRFDWDLANE